MNNNPFKQVSNQGKNDFFKSVISGDIQKANQDTKIIQENNAMMRALAQAYKA